MPQLRFEISMSLDGYIAGPDPGEKDPLGVGGTQLHDWALKLEAWRRPHGREGGEVNASTPIVEDSMSANGATIMGRNMFGGEGPWGEDPWNGWWGDDPPFNNPVFVLTHYEREPLEMKRNTTFHFVTDGIESALERAKDVAGDKKITLGGGADVAQQYLVAGLIDEVRINLVPVLLGGGTRLFENIPADAVRLELDQVIPAPEVTHLRYRVAR